MNTLKFATDELNKYIKKSGCTKSHNIKTGLFEDFSVDFHGDDRALDDEIYINVDKLSGIIAGSNERSVLIGVYRFLKECGFFWPRPGEDALIYPAPEQLLSKVCVCEKASYRHRGICIEGANTLQNVLDLVDWLPKIGCNSYQTQFMRGTTFFSWWSNHVGNPLLPSEEISIETVDYYYEEIQKSIAQRGLLYHAVGHGWTSAAIEVSAEGWYETDEDVPEQYKEYIAQIGGERTWFKKMPLCTNLCYSQNRVKERFSDEVVKYASEHSNISMLHVWLADEANNNCECEECSKLRIADYYVDILNMIDQKLTEKNLDTKIVFLIYLDTMYPPVEKKFVNPDRFVLMFAPITRTFTKPLRRLESEVEVQEYSVNNITRYTLEQSLQLLKHWQTDIKADSFDFDYHFMLADKTDIGGFEIAKILTDDIREFEELGINGLISCQPQRQFCPTGFAVYAMGETLWQKDADFEKLTDTYFKNTFGTDWELCRDYLKKLSSLWKMEELRKCDNVKISNPENYLTAAKCIEDFALVIEKNANEASVVSIRDSWAFLGVHAKIYYQLSMAFYNAGIEKIDEAMIYWNKAIEALRENELEYQRFYDVRTFMRAMKDYPIFDY